MGVGGIDDLDQAVVSILPIEVLLWDFCHLTNNVTFFFPQDCHPWISWWLPPSFEGTKLIIFFSISIETLNAFLDYPYIMLVCKTLISSILHPSLQIQHSHQILGPLLGKINTLHSLTTISREFPEKLLSFTLTPIISCIWSYRQLKFLAMLTSHIIWYFSYQLSPDIFSSAFQLRLFEYLNHSSSGSAGALAPFTASIYKTLLLY